jgi:hypothetical protein
MSTRWTRSWTIRWSATACGGCSSADWASRSAGCCRSRPRRARAARRPRRSRCSCGRRPTGRCAHAAACSPRATRRSATDCRSPRCPGSRRATTRGCIRSTRTSRCRRCRAARRCALPVAAMRSRARPGRRARRRCLRVRRSTSPQRRSRGRPPAHAPPPTHGSRSGANRATARAVPRAPRTRRLPAPRCAWSRAMVACTCSCRPPPTWTRTCSWSRRSRPRRSRRVSV